MNYKIVNESIENIIENIVECIENHSRTYFVCANPHSLVVSRSDPLFTEAIINANFIVPDGIGIVIASQLHGGSIKKRITGSDIFYNLSNELNKTGKYSYFFLGSTESTLDKIVDRLNRDYPNITVAGTYSPPFKAIFNDEDNRIMIEKINYAKPDVLWVGMTAPKQEKWIFENLEKLNVKFIGPVGAVFDFYSGNIKRSHPIFQHLGLEWLPRFLRSPRRLWQRNLISTPLFLFHILRSKLNLTN